MTAQQSALSMKVRYPGLDGLRAVAMLAVFLNHYNLRPTSRVASFLSLHGFSGVQIFFVLSGFLITGILWDSRERPHRLRDFYARRALRIFPLYYLVWLCILLITPFAGWPWNLHWLLYVVHLGNFVPLLFDNQYTPYVYRVLIGSRSWLNDFHVSHFWSLCVEEQFYLVWPWMVYRCKTREQLRNLCFGFVAFAAFARVIFVLAVPQDKIDLGAIYFTTFTQVDALAWGGLLAVMLRGKSRHFLTRNNGRITLALLCAPIAYLVTYSVLYGLRADGWPKFMCFATLPCFDLLGVALVLRSIHPRSELQRALSWKPLAAFGTITYGFYIFHNIPISLYYKIGNRIAPGQNAATITGVIAFVATLIPAWLSFKYFESPLLRLKRNFEHQTHRNPAA